MINKDDIIEIGQFRRTHALKGELNASLDVDEDFFETDTPIITEVDGILVPFFVESIRTKGADSFLLKLSGIDSSEQATPFVNKPIFVNRDVLREYFDDQGLEMAEDFVGYKVIDAELGEIGEVSGVDDSTENVLFIVDGADGNTIYVPAAEEFIDNIDDENKIIETSLPEGLVDLNS